MGADKAALPARVRSGVPGGVVERDADERAGLSLAGRTAALLQEVTELALEVGQGFSGLEHVSESPPQSGPLAAMAAGGAELRYRGWDGPVLLVPTDLPSLTSGMLRWLVGYQPGASVVPLLDARPQPLCARYAPRDIELAERLVEAGRFAMFDLLEDANPLLVPQEVWIPHAGDPNCLTDVDTPQELDTHPGRLT